MKLQATTKLVAQAEKGEFLLESAKDERPPTCKDAKFHVMEGPHDQRWATERTLERGENEKNPSSPSKETDDHFKHQQKEACNIPYNSLK